MARSTDKIHVITMLCLSKCSYSFLKKGEDMAETKFRKAPEMEQKVVGKASKKKGKPKGKALRVKHIHHGHMGREEYLLGLTRCTLRTIRRLREMKHQPYERTGLQGEVVPDIPKHIRMELFRLERATAEYLRRYRPMYSKGISRQELVALIVESIAITTIQWPGDENSLQKLLDISEEQSRAMKQPILVNKRGLIHELEVLLDRASNSKSWGRALETYQGIARGPLGSTLGFPLFVDSIKLSVDSAFVGKASKGF